MSLTYKEIKNSGIENPKIFYYVERIKEICRTALLDWFTSRERPTILDLPDELVGKDVIGVAGSRDELYNLNNAFAMHVPKKGSKYMYEGNEENPVSLPTEDMYVYGIYKIPGQDQAVLLMKLSDDAHWNPFSMSDRFMLEDGMIANYKGKPILTDVGKFLCNYLALADPFGDVIPYHNGLFDMKKIGKKIAKGRLEGTISRKQYNKYMNNCSWYGMDGSICVTTLTDKSLVTDPAIAKRKKELLEQYKNNLDDPIVTARIEKELIEMDKAWIKGDKSEVFFNVTGGKVYKEIRKKCYIMYGLAVGFDKNTGSYTFTADSLEDGWSKNTMPVLANDIRRGAYGRGVDTAKGGEQTKYLTRAFQSVLITEDDCGSKQGIEVVLTESNWKNYNNRFLVDGTIINDNTIDKLLNKKVTIRSPMYCHTKNGFCYQCCGDNTRRRGLKAIGMDGLAITGTLMQISMDSMHLSSIPSTVLESINKYIIDTK